MPCWLRLQLASWTSSPGPWRRLYPSRPVSSSATPFRVYTWWRFWRPMWSVLHLEELKVSCHSSAQRTAASRSAWRARVSEGLETPLYSLLSSANILTALFISPGRSFTFRMNSRGGGGGGRTEPCGTPLGTGAHCPSWPTATHNDPLFSPHQKGLQPPQYLPTDTISFHLTEQLPGRYSVECLGEIPVQDVHRLPLLDHAAQLFDNHHQLRGAGSPPLCRNVWVKIGMFG